MSRRSRDPFLSDCLDCLAVVGDLRPRPMFGGTGIFRGRTMFALAHGGRLYLKTDSRTRERFEAAGGAAFQPPAGAGWRSTMSYHEMPADGWASEEGARRWAQAAIAAAHRDPDARPG